MPSFGETPRLGAHFPASRLRKEVPLRTLRVSQRLVRLLGDSRTSCGQYHLLLSTFNFVFNFYKVVTHASYKGVETTHCRSPRAALISNIITVTFSVPSHFGGYTSSFYYYYY